MLCILSQGKPRQHKVLNNFKIQREERDLISDQIFKKINRSRKRTTDLTT